MRAVCVALVVGLCLVSSASADDDTERLKKEVERLRDQLKRAENQIAELTASKNKLRDELVAEKIKAHTTKQSMERFQYHLDGLRKEFAAMKSGKAAPDSISRPDKTVEAVIDSVDGALIRINRGSDDGLEKGHHLEVFRPGTNPRYLGQVVVVLVTAKTSVVRAKGRMSAPAEKGDKVVSRIGGEEPPPPRK